MARLHKSVWLFPAICGLLLLVLTSLQVSGSSVGVYHSYFYGNSKDPSLLLNTPRPIRSDEWLTNTQMTIAQKNDGFARVNHNIGDGQDMAITLDVPYKDWSTVFKPQNWAFFVMPLGYALAFKWWLMAFLLVTASYFFVLFLLPGKRLFAALFSVALLFSPFVQWWYQFITLGSIYYSLFMMLAFAYLLRAKKRSHELLLGAAFAYLLISFVLILYPPFQIACGLVAGAFMLGYFLEKLPKLKRPELLVKLGVLAAAVIIAGAAVLVFVHANSTAISATRNSAYPGHRTVLNGGFDATRLFSSNLAFLFQFTGKAVSYYFPTRGIPNQSEASNFLYLMPFLFPPGLFLIYKGFKRPKRVDWPLLVTSLLFIIFMMRLFVMHFDSVFKLLLLDNVPHNRLVIGTGFLGIVYTVLLVRNMARLKRMPFMRYQTALYALAVYAAQIILGFRISERAPGFINHMEIAVLAVPFAVIVYLLLECRFSLAAAGLLLFSVFCSGGVNPLYRGLSVLTETPLSQKIQDAGKTGNGRWVTESTMLENYAIMNGVRSLSGTYTYPQLQLWKDIPAANPNDYNRYAHVDFSVDHNPDTDVPASLTLRGGDNFLVTAEPCGEYLKSRDVHFLLTQNTLSSRESCARLIDTVKYPTQVFYIYRLN